MQMQKVRVKPRSGGGKRSNTPATEGRRRSQTQRGESDPGEGRGGLSLSQASLPAGLMSPPVQESRRKRTSDHQDRDHAADQGHSQEGEHRTYNKKEPCNSLDRDLVDQNSRVCFPLVVHTP